eukprot:GEMP01001267.1.p1 GENE.GEMP01001267.1~~GEMP01001267.1.p1  ORF type:complete len:1662 (+),score=431.87 GEMP01001267.1:196-5181(+)
MSTTRFQDSIEDVDAADGKMEKKLSAKKDRKEEECEKLMGRQAIKQPRRLNPFMPKIVEATVEELIEAGPHYFNGVEAGTAKEEAGLSALVAEWDAAQAGRIKTVGTLVWDLVTVKQPTGDQRESLPVREDLKEAMVRIAEDVQTDFDDLLKLYQIRAHAHVADGNKDATQDDREFLFFEALVKQLVSSKYRDRLIVAKYLHVIAIRDEASARRFWDAKGMEPLQKFLRSSDDLQEFVPTVISALSCSEANRESLLQKGTINALLRLSKKTAKNPNLMLSVSIAMAVLSVYPDTAQKLSENMDPVLEVLSIGDDVSKQHVGAALCMLTRTDANQSMIVYKNGVQAISKAIMNTKDVLVQFWMTATLANLARNPMNAKALMHLQVLEVLHFSAQSLDANVRRNVAWTILFLSNHKVAHQSVTLGVPIAWIRDMLTLSLDADRETLDVLQLAFTHFIGVDRHSLTDSPAVQEFMQRFASKQDKIKDTALRYVYQIMEEDVLEDLIISLMKGCCDSDQATKVDSLWLLNVLFLDNKYYSSVIKYGGITPLIVFAATNHEEVQRLSARTLVRVALEKDLFMEVKDEQPLCALLLLCESHDLEVRKSAVVSLWIASILGRDNRSMREAILDSCMNDVGAADLQASMRARLLPLSEKFVQSHTLAADDCSLAGLQCLAALARNASPDVQGRVAFRLRELVKKATMLTPLSRKCLIFSLLAVQESQITQVATSIVGAWYDLCMDFLKNLEGDAGFSVECAKALMNMIMNPNSSSGLRTQSVTSLLNMVNVSPHVCAYMGDPYLLRQLLDCQKPEWGVDCLPLWVILLKVLSSPLCECTYTLLLEHMDTIDQILEAMRIESGRNEIQTLAVPLVALLEKCASWPVFNDRLMARHGGLFVDLLQLGLEEGDDNLLISTAHSLVRIFISITESRYTHMIEHYDDLVQRIFEMLKYATSKAAEITAAAKSPRPHKRFARQKTRPSIAFDDNARDILSENNPNDETQAQEDNEAKEAICEELMHLSMQILASLSNHKEVRALIAENSYLDLTVLEMFLNLPYPRVLAEFFLFLNNCCHSEVLFKELSKQSLIRPLIRHAERSTDPDTIRHMTRLCYQFCLKPQTREILMENNCVDALFAIVKKGSPEAQEVAVQSIYHLATDEKVKRDIIRKGLLTFLCDLAETGPVSVQPHAAWLVASLVVRGNSRDLMYQRNTLSAITNLLSATNPKVITQAAWALSHVPLEEDVISKLIHIGTATKILNTLTFSPDDSVEVEEVQRQGAITIGTLSKNKLFRSQVVSGGVVQLLVRILLHTKCQTVQCGIAIAIREISQSREYAQEFLKAGAAPGLVMLLQAKSVFVRRAALGTIVPLLLVPSEISCFLDANAIQVMLDGVVEDMGEEHDDDICGEFRTNLSHDEPSTELSLAQAIRIFATDDRAKAEFRQYNGFDILMKLSENASPDIQEEVAWAVGVLASDPDTETCLAEIGAIDKLIYYTNTSSETVIRRAQWSLGMLTPKAVRYNEILKQRGGLEAALLPLGPESKETPISETKSKKVSVLLTGMASLMATINVQKTEDNATDKAPSPTISAPKQQQMRSIDERISPSSVAEKSNNERTGAKAFKNIKGKLAAKSAMNMQKLNQQKETHIKDIRDMINQLSAAVGENNPESTPPAE